MNPASAGLSGGLTLVAVDGGGGDARLGQIPRHPVGAVLGAGKHQGGGDVLVVDQLDQQFGLVVLDPPDRRSGR